MALSHILRKLFVEARISLTYYAFERIVFYLSGTTSDDKEITYSDDKNIQLIEREIRFMLCHFQAIEGNFATVDELTIAGHSKLSALDKYKLSLQVSVRAHSGQRAGGGLITAREDYDQLPLSEL